MPCFLSLRLLSSIHKERDNSLSPTATEYITQINYYMGISHKHMVVSDVQSKSIQKTCILKRFMWFEGWLVCCRLTSIYTQLNKYTY